MTEAEQHLTLAQWLSPAFPLGSFAYSHGLETAIVAGVVKDAETLADWLSFLVTSGSAWNDAVLLCAAQRGEDVGALARALASSRERWEEAEAQGTAFAATLRALGRDAQDAPLPVAAGMATRSFTIAPSTITALYLQAFTANLVQCAVRFMPLGQSVGQRVLAGLAPVILQTAERAALSDLGDLGSAAFHSDLAAMNHETQEARIFQS